MVLSIVPIDQHKKNLDLDVLIRKESLFFLVLQNDKHHK